MRLWRSLEEVPGWAAVQSVWREHLGDELTLLKPLLHAIAARARSQDVAGRNERFSIVVHTEDDIVAVDPETGETTALDLEDIVIWKLDAGSLMRSIAAALGLVGSPSAVGVGDRLWWLGDFVPIEGVRFPVYMATSRDARDLLASAAHAAAFARKPFVLVTPTRGGSSEPLDRCLQGHAAAWLVLEEKFDWNGDGVFRSHRPTPELLADFVQTHAPVSTRQDESGRFPTPSDAHWEDLSLRVVDGQTLRVNVLGQVREIGYIEMGMRDGRTKQPDKQWKLLLLFASRGGLLRRRDPAASSALQKRKETLAKRLKTYFGIAGDPIELIDGVDWRCRFRIEAPANS